MQALRIHYIMGVMMKFSKIKDYAMVGGIGVAVAFAMYGCEDSNTKDSSILQNAQKNGAFVIIEEQQDGSYKILEEYPSDTTRVLLKTLDGQERMLSDEEISQLIAQEERKIDAGTSELTNPNSGGLGLGGAILASAAGAILGSYIGNKLFNNPNFQANAQRNYKSPQAYERSKNSFSNKSTSSSGLKSTSGRSGFFGNNSSSSGRAGGSSVMGG